MKSILPLISAGLFLWACFSRVFIVEEGYSSFLMGVICLLFGFSELSWYANPALLAAWIAHCTGNFRIAGVFAAVAFGLGLTALLIVELPRDESGVMIRILGFCRGYYLWMAVHLVMVLSGVWFCVKTRSAKRVVP